ncbi:hypothetical protein ACQP1G_24660 [Nocardia sp. CA-107356]|uniref:hypothetical protein n=1 Tax=Nocardia sp. CA-107356 TaxID=3239972 RepID=UPI003D93F4C1
MDVCHHPQRDHRLLPLSAPPPRTAIAAAPDNPSTGDAELDTDEAVQKELASCLVPMLSALPAQQAAAVKMVDLDARTHAAARAVGYLGIRDEIPRPTRPRRSARTDSIQR